MTGTLESKNPAASLTSPTGEPEGRHGSNAGSKSGGNVRLQISDIDIGQHTQVRTGINEDTVQAYHDAMIEGAIFPPVVVFHDGSDYVMADGFHRLMATVRVDYTEIDAVIHQGTAQDALWHALGANKTNGQRMSKGDVRNAVIRALKAFPDRTQKAIAEQVGCAQSYVASIKAGVNITSDIETPETITNARGQQRPTSYKAKTDPPKSQPP